MEICCDICAPIRIESSQKDFWQNRRKVFLHAHSTTYNLQIFSQLTTIFVLVRLAQWFRFWLRLQVGVQQNLDLSVLLLPVVALGRLRRHAHRHALVVAAGRAPHVREDVALSGVFAPGFDNNAIIFSSYFLKLFVDLIYVVRDGETILM